MKNLLLFLSLIFSLATAPIAAIAKDKKSDDDLHKLAKELHADMTVLQQHHDQVRDRVKYLGGDRRQWDELQVIQGNIDNLSAQLSTGRFDLRDVQARIQQGHDDLIGVQNQLEDKNKHRSGGGGFYQPK